MREETNIEHAANPLVGDYWHERFSPAFLVIDVSRFSVSFLSKTKRVPNDITWEQDLFWDVSHIETCTPKEFKRRVSYNSIPGTWCDVTPNWSGAAEYIEEALAAAEL
jgi:hypothetical protein